MQDSFSLKQALPQVTAAMKRTGKVEAVLLSCGRGTYDFPTDAVPALQVELDGIAGERHFGWTRPADSRLPMYRRGTPVRNTRALSLISTEDLAEMAERLGIATVDPRWIGANVVVSGIPRFTFLPRASRLKIGGGAFLLVEDLNKPCRFAGKIIADNTGRDDIELSFARLAVGLRGVVASVEHPGRIEVGAGIDAMIPEQWIYD